jgi:Flp pilus assembly protein TadG
MIMGARSSHSRAPRRNRGQAVIELALSLPFLILLIFFTFNSFHMLHTSHVAQRYAAMNVYQRIQNRTQFVFDDVANQEITRGFAAAQYMESDGNPPQRKIVRNLQKIQAAFGICRETGC